MAAAQEGVNPGTRRSTPGPAAAEDGLDFGLRPGIGARRTGPASPSAVSGTAPPLGPAATSTTGSTPRQGLRPPKTRRTRQPTAVPVMGPFRSTLAPPAVAAEIQPIQSGVPDLAVPAAAAVPGAQLRRRAQPEDAYAPLGLRLGTITAFPVIGQSIGYDDNPNRTRTDKRGSFVSRTEGELRLQSDWSRHALTGELRGAYNAYPSNPEANRPEGAGRIGLRYDISRDTEAEAEARFQIDTQRPGSPDLGVAVRERPIVYQEGATLGVTQRFNRLQVSLRGTVDRYDYQDARLTNGTVLDQSDRNMTQFGGRLRLGYEVQPGFTPFVEALGDTRVYDQKIDNSGFARSSDGYGARLGSSFELTRLITGEISAGAIHRSYQDPRLKGLTSPIAEATLSWALTPLTTIRATAAATVDETTVPNATGIRTVRGGLEVAHDLRRNVTLTAGVTAGDSKYQGVAIDEQSFGATLRADWRLNRNVALRASYAFEKLVSSVPSSSYQANVFLLGLRIQP